MLSLNITRSCCKHGFASRRGCYVLVLLLLAVTVLLLQCHAISQAAGEPGSSNGAIPATPGVRDLLQQHAQHRQQQEQDVEEQGAETADQQDALFALAGDPSEDPFAGAYVSTDSDQNTATTAAGTHARSKASLLGRLSALLPKTLRQQLDLLRRSMQRAVQASHSGSGASSGSGGLAHLAALHRRQHPLKVVRTNTTHAWMHSTVLNLELPQAWDRNNLTSIVRDNLEPDVSFWQALQWQPSVEDILHMAQHHPQLSTLPATSRLVEIRGNKLRFPLMPPGPKQTSCNADCDPQLQGFVDGFQAAVQRYNMTFPDVLFLLNTNDAPICTEEQVMRGECRAPVISLSKEAGVADLVGPVLRPADAHVVHRTLPWGQKQDKAFFRGVPSCGQMPFPPGCARSWVSRMAQLNYSADLDAGIVEAYNRSDQIAADPVLRDGHGPLPVLPRVPLADAVRYKYLLNLDGHTAAYRLGQLLATNSLVLKQESMQVEHYYRSLRAFHHYVPILKHSEHDLMPRLTWARQHEPQVQRIVHNANRFALRYVTLHARLLYLKYVLLAYRSLVQDMQQYFEQSGSAGIQMEVLLKSLAGLGSKHMRAGGLPADNGSSSSSGGSKRWSIGSAPAAASSKLGSSFRGAAGSTAAVAAFAQLAGDEASDGLQGDGAVPDNKLSALAGDD